MGELNESKIQSVVRSELSQLAGDLRRLNQQIARYETRLQQIQQYVEEIRTRIQHVEERSKYTAGYVALRLKERYEREH